MTEKPITQEAAKALEFALERCSETLAEYIQSLERDNARLHYGRSVLRQAHAALRLARGEE